MAREKQKRVLKRCGRRMQQQRSSGQTAHLGNVNKILIHKNIDQIANSIDVTEKITKTFLIENNPIEKILLEGGDKNISLTIDNPNLDNLKKDELIKLLIYIDSLRSDDGLQDKKFIALQNKIVELLNKNIF